MKVLMLNGSSHSQGCTYTALSEMGKIFTSEDIDFEIFQIGTKPVRDCIACHQCSEMGCVFDDGVNEFITKAKEADAFVFGTPVYYAHPSGAVLSFLDRAFFSCKDAFMFKPGTVVASARRAGTSASLDVLSKYFTFGSMPIPTSTYWNMVHGANAEQVVQDLEGMQVMRNLARSMSWMMKSLDLAKKSGISLPEMERTYQTNFIR